VATPPARPSWLICRPSSLADERQWREQSVTIRDSGLCSIRNDTHWRVLLLALAFAILALLANTCDLSAQAGPHLKPLVRRSADEIGLSGLIADVTSDSMGRLLILDEAQRSVIVVDSGLQLVSRVGRSGAGPGEFREPTAIGSWAGGRFAVLDRAIRRITVFRRKGGEPGYEVETTIPLRFGGEYFCTLPHNSMLVYGAFEGNRLHVLDIKGHIRRSFAPSDAHLSPMSQGLMSRGAIACDIARGEVLVSSKFSPAVEAFRLADGERIWADSLHPFRPLTLEQTGGRTTISSGRAGFSAVSRIAMSGDNLVVQATYESRIDSATVDTVMSYIRSRSKRRWLLSRTDLPVFYAISRGRALAVSEEDLMVTLYRVLSR
jgi:hypothetical protein